MGADRIVFAAVEDAHDSQGHIVGAREFSIFALTGDVVYCQICKDMLLCENNERSGKYIECSVMFNTCNV